MFCFYCGCLGHNERVCTHLMQDLDKNNLQKDQFGPWMRASLGRAGEGGAEGVETSVVGRQERWERIREQRSLGRRLHTQ